VEKGLDEFKQTFDQTISTFKEKGEELVGTVSKKKKVYVEKIEDQLKDWSIQIDILKAKADKSKAEIKIKYLKQIEELRSKQGALKQKLGDLKDSGEEAWEDFKGGVEEALSDMKKALKRATSRFK
jgi:TolA-binding protein